MTKKAKPQISVILTPEDRQALYSYCNEMDITVSQLIRRLLRTHLGTHQAQAELLSDLKFEDE